MSTELASPTGSEAVALLTMDDARVLTDEVKADTAALWAKLLRLYEGDAHTALGYSSWRDYWTAEFGEDGSRGDQLLRAARVMEQLETKGNFSPGPLPATDSVAREMAPLLKEHAEDIPVVWGEVVEEHGPTPTAKQVKEIVARHASSAPPQPEHEHTYCPTCGHRLRVDQPLRPRGDNQ